jgi:hypothetical protein
MCSTSQICQGGACTPCPSGETACDGTTVQAVEGGHKSCVNEQTDANNCGRCGYMCPAQDGICQRGACVRATDAGTDGSLPVEAGADGSKDDASPGHPCGWQDDAGAKYSGPCAQGQCCNANVPNSFYCYQGAGQCPALP